MRDKVPKGDYVIRAGMLDRLVENKLYYKFIEYGERVKEQRMIDQEREKKAQKQDMSALNILMSQENEEKEEDESVDDEAAYKSMMARPLFNTDEDEEDEDPDSED